MANRRFPTEQMDLCNAWFNTIQTEDSWTELDPIGEGESQAIRVKRSDGLIGVAKPGVPKSDNICRAAHEKIAFDLAHLLELPVPPVILWDRGAAHNDNQYLSISAWAFQQSKKWTNAQQEGIITDVSRTSALHVISAMRVFHTWISDTDRKTDHIQINLKSSQSELGIAFIDHAFSMSYVWKSDNHPSGPSGKYMPDLDNNETMTQVADAIAILADDDIRALINRVPEVYLPDVKKEHIICNLLNRKGRLKNMLSIA